MIIPKENENHLTDIPTSISKQIDIALVEHMDEVLSHALILREGETLFKETMIYLLEFCQRRPNQEHL